MLKRLLIAFGVAILGVLAICPVMAYGTDVPIFTAVDGVGEPVVLPDLLKGQQLLVLSFW